MASTIGVQITVMTSDTKAMAERIRTLMRRRKITKKDLAIQVPCCRATAYNWVEGIKTPHRDKQPRLAAVLGTTVGGLNGWSRL